jgi:hypothetical protein
VLKTFHAPLKSHLGADLTPRDLVLVVLGIVVSNSDVSRFLGLVEHLKVLKASRAMCSHLGADLTPRDLVQVELGIVASNSDVSQFLGLAVCLSNREPRQQVERLKVLKVSPAPRLSSVNFEYKARNMLTTYQHWRVS